MVDVKGEVMMDKELEDILQKNPWQPLADALRNALSKGQDWKSIPMYAKDDEKHVADLNLKFRRGGGRRAKKRYWSCQLRYEYPPIPFIGTPEADVWLLLMNPGFSPLDYYNFIDREEGCRRMVDRELKEKTVPTEWLKRDDVDRFARRRDLYAKSLDFSIVEPSQQFYVLDECMDTIEQVGKKLNGGYNWYGRNLFKGWQDEGGNLNDSAAFFKASNQAERLRIASSRIFDLEFAPYHSINFTKPEDYTEFAHTQFWESLVKYALTHGKKLIVRGCNLLKLVESVDVEAFHLAVEERRILRFVSSQNVSLSYRNLVDEHPARVL
ncbi:MAG: hypothetical protein Q4G65_05405 [bacterium]|nr:hypothetical protein [bacterium]